MMKKLLTGILVFAMLLTTLSAAFAAAFTTEDGGLTLEVPEGMTVTDASGENGYLLNITVDGNANLQFACYVANSEEIAGKGFEDLTEEESEQLLAGLTEGMEDPISSLVEREGVPVLVVENGAATMAHLVAMGGGWLCDVAVVKHDGVAFTDDEVNTAAEMLLSIQFGGGE